MDKSGVRNGRPSLFRWGDAVVILAVLLLAGASFFLLIAGSRPGASAVITTPEGEITWELSRDNTWELTGRDGIPVVIEAADGRIRFYSSGCPDQICVHSAWLSREGQSAACIPAGIALKITDRQRRGRGHDDRLRRNRRA